MTETNSTITEKTAKAYVALGKLECIIFKSSIPKDEIKLSLYRRQTIFDTLIAMQNYTLSKADIIDAHSALDKLQYLALKNAKEPLEKHEINVFAEAIQVALPPKPTPTMADIKWDDNEHFLAEAKHPECGKVIMLDGDHQYTFVIDTHNNATNTLYIDSEDLTPTGRRYTLND